MSWEFQVGSRGLSHTYYVYPFSLKLPSHCPSHMQAHFCLKGILKSGIIFDTIIDTTFILITSCGFEMFGFL